MKSVYLLIIGCILLISNSSQAQEKPSKYPVNGYYITLSGDTIYGNLKNKEQMYLHYRDASGKKKVYTPSKIRSYNLDNQEYRPMYLENIDKKRFVAVVVTGEHTLYLYNDGSIPGMVLGSAYMSPVTFAATAVAGGIAEGIFDAHNSGYYITKPGIDKLYSIPSTDRLIIEFFQQHFGGLPDMELNGCEKLVYCLKDIVLKLNTTNK